ncbi:hypothetical protein [Streptomyces sp. NPDC048637]|uniref:hypothetical protein n=1 Tax=Streptomyces sp. NPDC048637 TaxID=3155636 RepID=UPI003425F421
MRKFCRALFKVTAAVGVSGVLVLGAPGISSAADGPVSKANKCEPSLKGSGNAIEKGPVAKITWQRIGSNPEDCITFTYLEFEGKILDPGGRKFEGRLGDLPPGYDPENWNIISIAFPTPR